MIHAVFSSLKTFKTLEFHQGLNVLLCEKSPGATEQQTRNRAGKSTFVELLNFVCGGNCDQSSTFRSAELIQESFGLDMDVFDNRVRVTRSAYEPSKIAVVSGETSRWPRQPKLEKKSNRRIISNAYWREVLGRAFFDITEDNEADEGSHPTFRSLFSYFARRENNGGMREPTRNSAVQQTGNAQISISYLIGLDWTIAQSWEAVRQREKQIVQLKKIVGQGVLSDVLDSAASLRSRLVVAEEKLKRIIASLASFRVHEQYRSLEREASALTRQLAELSDENDVDRGYIEELDRAMQAETPPLPEDLARLYEESGVILPDLVRRRYEDVLAFHESVIRNRRSYLQSEHSASLRRVNTRDAKRADLDRRRSELMQMLRSHGALEQFVALQGEQGRLQGETEALRRRFEAASQLESTSSSLESDRAHLVERLRQEFDERGAVLDEAIRRFSDVVDELYGETGQLEFHPTRNGPDIRITISGDRSRGIGNMELFCFDMMLQWMCARQEIGPGFLVHDSHLFDGVDPRQTGRALLVGAKLADEIGFQYIVTLNSDVLNELPEEFNIDAHIIPQRLSDATEDGGLFGIRFEPPRANPEEAIKKKSPKKLVD